MEKSSETTNCKVYIKKKTTNHKERKNNGFFP